MAISRLLLPPFQTKNRGLVNSTISSFFFSSGEQEKLFQLVSSSTENDIKMHPSASLKAAETQNKVGAAWSDSIAKFSELKENMVVNKHLIKISGCETSDTTTQNSQLPEGKINSLNDADNIPFPTSSASQTLGESSSVYGIEKAPGVIEKLKCKSKITLCEPEKVLKLPLAHKSILDDERERIMSGPSLSELVRMSTSPKSTVNTYAKSPTETSEARSRNYQKKVSTSATFRTRKETSAPKTDQLEISDRPEQVKPGFGQTLGKGMDVQTEEAMDSNRTKSLLGKCSGNFKGVTQADVEDEFVLLDLVDCVRKIQFPKDQRLHRSDANKKMNFQKTSIDIENDLISKKGSTEKIQSQANLLKSDANKKQASLIDHAACSESIKSCENNEDLDTQTPLLMATKSMDDQVKSRSSPQVPLHTYSSKDEFVSYKALVRFLSKKHKDADIHAAFSDCGPIVSIEKVSFSKSSRFKDAFIGFKTREGLQNALKINNPTVGNFDVVVEAVSSADIPKVLSIPNLIGDPEVPVSLVKHPTLTIKVEQLTGGIRSSEVKEALGFCHSNISSFFLGSSSSVGYVEFETEAGKERALAKHSIFVQGKPLFLFRIDTPRTTVVRISSSIGLVKNISSSLYRSYGQVHKVVSRSDFVSDVYFKLSEWPNMVYIINSLNGLKVDGYKIQAQPARVIPPEVLRVLWSQPNEKARVIAMLHDMVKRIEQPIDVGDISDFVNKRFGKAP